MLRHWTIPWPPVKCDKVCAVCDQPCDYWFGSIYDDGEENQCNDCCDKEIEQADQAYLDALQTDSDHPTGNIGAKEAYLNNKGKGKGKGAGGKDKDKGKGKGKDNGKDKDKGAGGKDKGARSRSRSPGEFSQRFDGDTAAGV